MHNHEGVDPFTCEDCYEEARWPKLNASADLSREHKRSFEWNPPRSLLASIRSHQRWRNSRWGSVWRKIAALRYRFWSAVTGADIDLRARIGLGLSIPHPIGVVIHKDAVIGPNCLVLSNVTLGTRGGKGAPTLGRHVDVGTGAKILGAVRIGDHAKIGANAVVLSDVPPYATAVGIPARISVNRRT